MAKTSRSPRFRAMEAEIRKLGQALLPRRFDPSGSYSPKEITRAAAYRVLAHAEIEAYLEDRSVDVVRQSVINFKKAGTVNKVLLALLAFSGQKYDLPPDTLAPPPGTSTPDWLKRLDLVEKIDAAHSSFYHVIQTNHGVKETNILKLLIPVGVDHSKLDPLWLATIDSFGETRGTYAR